MRLARGSPSAQFQPVVPIDILAYHARSQRANKFLTYPMGIGFDYRYLTFMKEPSASGLSAVQGNRMKQLPDFS